MNDKVLGLDCGNVILSQMNGTPVPGALDAIQKIVASGLFTKDQQVNVWIVSKCGQRVADLSKGWLKDLNFWNFTGIPDNQIRFCRTRSGKDPICTELGITHFVDDRLDVLDCLQTVRNLYAFNPRQHQIEQFSHVLARTHKVHNWQELTQLLLQ